MITGAMIISKVIEKSYCRISEDYYLSKVADYKIHSTSLMPHIPFEKAKIIVKSIDKSIFLNVDETELRFDNQIKTQNYLTTHYVGRAPYVWYGPKTKMGEKFQLVCVNGDPEYKYRYFGTEGSLINNPNSNDLETYKK